MHVTSARRLLLPAAAILAVAPGCVSGNERGEIPLDAFMERVTDLFGRTPPLRRVQRLAQIHDTATFRHEPDTPDTWEACRSEVAALGRMEYGDAWAEVALAAYMGTRVLVDDASALNRGEAAVALAAIGRLLAAAEDPPAGPPATDADFLKGFQRIKALHTRDGHDPSVPDADRECTEILRRMGDYRPEGDLGAPPGALRARMSELRGVVNLVVLGGHYAEKQDPEGRRVVSRTIVNASAQAVRAALVLSLRTDTAEAVRVAAADALGGLGAAEAVAGLVRALPSEESRSVRREIVQSLALLAAGTDGAREAAVPVLLGALSDEDSGVRLNARDGLAAVAGRDLGEDVDAWSRWWGDHRRGSR